MPLRGSTANNLVWPLLGQPGRNLCVFKDERPGTPAGELYKATGWEPRTYFDRSAPRGLCMLALISPDGLHWRQIAENPIYVPETSALDSHNQTFWDPWQKQYVGYWRINIGDVRNVMRTTSADFRKWSKPEVLALDMTVHEQFYTTSALPYQRSPGTYVMFPSRYVADRNLFTTATPGRPETNTKIDKGVNDVAFLSSRDGIHWDWSLREAFLRPGRDPRTWYDRSLYMDRGILQTSPDEMSLFVMENLRTSDVHIRRVTLRTDGFVSVHAGYRAGDFTTPPLRFAGKRLELNCATSAVGFVKVEIQEATGAPIAGFSERDGEEVFGDHLERRVGWGPEHSGDLARLGGRTVRLRFVLRDADLYSFRFVD
ncbi:MAG: hypothetical protein DMG07_27310 [Acidobacteria bacterium]|nr:MAG: hypothetical protein DMG07_27310 [Acidobacteriota bacterium]